MVRTGRPKKASKKDNRRHSVLLSEKAELIYREIKKKRPQFNLSRYLCEHLVRDFEDPESQLKEEIRETQKQIDLLYKKNNDLAEKLRAYREQKQFKIINEEADGDGIN